MLVWPNKDPDEVLDYQIDWTARLETGEAITTSDILVAEGDVTVDSDAEASGIVTLGQLCVITSRIVTDQGRTYDQSVALRIQTL